MRNTRIYTAENLQSASMIELTGAAARHIVQALRMKPGDTITLFDDSGHEFAGKLLATAKNSATVELGESTSPERESPVRITLWHGLCRSGRMDTVIQKATELGVSEILPVIASRSTVRLDEQRAAKKLEHWRNVAVSACEQSGRLRVPKLHPPEKLLKKLGGSSLEDDTLGIMCDPQGHQALSEVSGSPADIILLTGPEGGFSSEEQQAAIAAGFKLVTMGPRVLRTETAPLAALSILQYVYGDLGD